ncbi:MAG: cytochrome b N-terminal domain-containing protein [Verrucomicrobiales bacterium]|nr:cytochrome b N-terminal domain-containing protein [Verrucomicrobiales bacterium]
MNKLIDWLEHRTGIKGITHDALFENVPGGSRWRYVWGSTLTFTLFVQIVTGVFLWMAYSPSSQTAWESVYYIQYEMSGGWLLRGLHHFTAHAMTILLALHLMQVVIDGAYKAPREVNFWFGLALLMLVLALSLTGYLLPWDQKGFWATKVTTNLAGITPVIGPLLQKLIVGGPDYGHHTLTRFFALHAGVLPGLIMVLVAGHLYLFRKHGITPKRPLRGPDAPFWPDQLLKDAVACLAVLATVLFFIIRPRLTSPDAPLGAELGAPADLSEPYSAARPEWYFLFLFQFLKAEWLTGIFGHHGELVGAIIIPGLLMLAIFAIPFLGRWRLGHVFNVGLLFSLLAGAGLLTYLAVAEDRRNANFQAALHDAEHNAVRVAELAKVHGIPQTGALTLLHDDPLTQGPKLFAKHCASCHRYGGHNGIGVAVQEEPTASDLKGFAGRDWLTGLLDPERIDSPHYFGGTKFKDGKMVKFVKRDIPKFDTAQRDQLRKVIAAVSAEAGLKAQAEADRRDSSMIDEGRKLITSADMRCTECHQFRKPDEDATAPDLTGFGSREWLTGFISDPAHERFYGRRSDRMPAFGQDQRLSGHEIGLLADWLRGQWYVAKEEPPVTGLK